MPPTPRATPPRTRRWPWCKKGVAFIRANGKDKGYAEISAKGGKFTDRDLYLVVYGLDGTVHAHGANEKMIGKNLIDLKDVDGKPSSRSVSSSRRARARSGRTTSSPTR